MSTARSPTRSPRSPRSPKSVRSPQSPASRAKEIRKLEEQYPDLASPDISNLRETLKPSKESTVGDPARLMTMDFRDPDRMSHIEKLRILKRDAIAKCDFDRSNAIQRYIDLKIIVDIDGVIDKAKEWLTEGIEAAIENYDANVEDINAEASDKRIRIRSDCDDVFRSVQERHVEDLTNLYMAQEVALESENSRLPADFRGMTRQAQKLASLDDTEGAKAIHAQAEKIRVEQVEKRKQEVKDRCERIAEHMTSKQEHELKIVQTSLSNLLNECDRNLEESLKEQKRKVAVYIKHSLNVAIQSSCDWLEKVEARTRVSTELTKHVKELMKKMNREELLNVSD